MRVPWIARRSHQSIVKETNSEYSLEGLMLKLKFQYFGHLMQTADSLEKTLTLGKIEGRRRRGQQRMRWLGGITDSKNEFEQALGDGEGQGGFMCCSLWGGKESYRAEQLNNSIDFSVQDGGMEDAKIGPMSPPCGHLLYFTF